MSDARTEEATPKRLRDARARGDVWRSRDLSAALSLLAFGLTAGAAGPALVTTFSALFARVIEAAAARSSAPFGMLVEASIADAARASAPLVLAPVAVGLVATFAQVGPLAATGALAWDASRLDPVLGLRRLASGARAVDVGRALMSVALVAAIAWGALRDGLPGVLSTAGAPVGRALAAAGALVSALTMRAGAALLGLGVLDAVYQRWRWHRSHRMTREETRREHREAEGDPHARHARDRLRQEIAQHDVLESVRRADVLVVNPTHLAVALRFDEASEQAAPEVVAKGQDGLARRMIDAAREAGVPVLRDVPLARGLYELELGDEIPEGLYEAVAVVLRAAWAERARDER